MNHDVFKRRVLFSSVIVVVIAVVLLIRIFSLHFSSKIYIKKNIKPVVRRGFIKDKNGYILAMSIEQNSLFANPEEIKKPAVTAAAISAILKIDEKQLISKLLLKKRFVWLKRKLNNNQYSEIKKLQLKGLHFRKEFKRIYPNKYLASTILGFVGIDGKGLEGIEYQFDKLLTAAGDDNKKFYLGKDILLTIDRYIQYVSEQHIKQAVLQNEAKQGVVAVLEVKTGRILAIAKYPNYDPNIYYKHSAWERRNFTVIDSFEPGSTMKVFSVAAILEHKPALFQRKYNCKGKVDIADATIHCTGNHGLLTIPGILNYSCNVGIIKSVRYLSKRKLYSTLFRFGFGTRTGCLLPAETDGILRPVKDWSGLSKYSIGIGHEISATSIQLMAAYAAIANGGIYCQPTIIESIKKGDGAILQSFYPRKKGRVISKQIAAKLLTMMKNVVAKGTAKKAASRFFTVAGKTGTSLKFLKSKNKYTDRVISSFIGVAPYENPDLCVLVVIDDAKNKGSGGTIAAPVFPKVIDTILPLRGHASRSYTIKRIKRTRSKLQDISTARVPSFYNLTVTESLKILVSLQHKKTVNYSFIGSGKVYRQYPLPGKTLKSKQKIRLYLR